MTEASDNDIESGNRALEQNNYHQAAFLFTKAKRDGMRTTEAIKGLAWTFYCQGLYPEALKAYRDCLEIVPSDFAALEGIGLTYYRLGMYDAAIQQMEIAATVDGSSSEPYIYLSRFYRGLKDYDAAQRSLAQAVIRAPHAVGTYLEQGSFTKEQKNFAEALNFYRLAGEIEPNNSDIPYQIARLQLELKDYEAANLSFLHSLDLNPDWPDALYGLALAETGLRHVSSAIQILETVIHLKPGFRLAYVRLARLYLRSFHLIKYWKTIKRGVAFSVRGN